MKYALTLIKNKAIIMTFEESLLARHNIKHPSSGLETIIESHHEEATLKGKQNQ